MKGSGSQLIKATATSSTVRHLQSIGKQGETALPSKPLLPLFTTPNIFLKQFDQASCESSSACVIDRRPQNRAVKAFGETEQGRLLEEQSEKMNDGIETNLSFRARRQFDL